MATPKRKPPKRLTVAQRAYLAKLIKKRRLARIVAWDA
jgi:hypothetical protein